MPVVHLDGKRSATKMVASEFSSEGDLEEMLAKHPYLLMDDGEPDLCLVKSQVSLAGTGILDLLLVDAGGRPTVVEVKLARNRESRREVLGQVFDYVSSLAELTVRELDQLVGGELARALRSFDAEDGDDEAAFQARWGACADALRAGNVRVVVAIDSAPQELIRIVRFVNDHADLDVRLVEVGRYEERGRGSILVPKILVLADETKVVERSRATASDSFVAVLNAYNAQCGAGLSATGRAAGYRQIKPEGWPKALHYELMDGARRLGVEIHIENDEVRPMATTLKELVPKLAPEFPECEVVFDPRWMKNRGRLRVLVDKSEGPEVAAKAMSRLIDLTLDPVTNALGVTPGKKSPKGSSRG